MALAVFLLAACGPVEKLDGGTGGGVTGGTGGGANGGGAGGGSASAFCAPCLQSSDCAGGGLCLGEVGHCGGDCSQGQACPTGTTCSSIGLGKMPVGSQCVPAAPACDVGKRLDGLSCTDSWASWAQGFFQTKCRSCHFHELAFGTEAEVRARPASIRLAVELRFMPPFGEAPLSTDERLRLFTWLACPATPSTPNGAKP